MQQAEIIINEKKVSYWQGGVGAPLLLIHGGIGNAELHWKHVWNQLADRYTVIAPNLPSFGGTSPLERAGFAQIADWVAQLMDALSIESANVLGNSFGGGVSRLMASRHERRVKRLILVNGGAIPNIPPFVGRMMQSSIFNGMFNMIRKQTFSFKGLAPMFADRSFLTNEFITQAEADSLGFVTLMRQSASEGVGTEVVPQVPTLVLWGEDDKFTKVSMGKNLAKMIPNAEFKLFMGAGHMPQIEKPDEFVKKVVEFFG
ncbi:MAG: alpha/beta hydrolase [Anaerolineales bacterium]|uniref:alpha/beta fold hydrolase n=1 Tax=Candidatus Villigracilis vicinus TaxID=3140679 RepID=UPI0031375D5B|nr:alpha/beta hydrolase [Anaerolineales bacterium]